MKTDTGDFSWCEVGARIRSMRLARGISQAQLANDANLSPPGLFAIEKGKINPQLSSLQNISKVLGCSVRELIMGPQSKPSGQVAGYLEQMRHVLESGNPAAVRTAVSGLETAKIILAELIDRPNNVLLARSDSAEIDMIRQMMRKMPAEAKPERSRSKGKR